MSDITLKHENPTYVSLNSHGLMEIRDLITDELIFYQKSLTDDVMQRSDLVRMETADGESVLCERGIDSDYSPSKQGKWPYSEYMAELIVDKIADGGKITDLGDGFPKYGTIWRWRKNFPDFEEALALAYKMKADRFLAEIEETNEDIHTISDAVELNATKAKIDNMKWLSEKHDPGRFGKSKEKNESGAMTIIVNTGIIRPEDTIIEVVKEEKIGKS